MCGIFFSCSASSPQLPSEDLARRLAQRGPDHSQLVSRRSSLAPFYHLTFLATVLSLRGDNVTKQPLEDSATGSCLCWNGEAWSVGGEPIVGNDSEVIFRHLRQAADEGDHADEGRQRREQYEMPRTQGKDIGEQVYSRIVDALRQIVGPYAFVFYDAVHSRVFYGRDVLGRRSLLFRSDENTLLSISSVSDPQVGSGWNEVEANGVYMLDFQTDEEPSISKIPWVADGSTASILSSSMTQRYAFNKLTPPIYPPTIRTSSVVVDELEKYLRTSLHLRVNSIPHQPSQASCQPRLAVLFSGGLDCALLTRLLHDIVPTSEEIDLLNVAFENPRVVQAASQRRASNCTWQSPFSLCPDRQTGLSSFAELRRVCHTRRWRFISINIPHFEFLQHRSQIVSLMQPHNTEMDLSIACALYFAARARGTICDETENSNFDYETSARILFSGLGADELFGGYTRHATAFKYRGYDGLVNELEKDYLRLSERNLGRDDRVMSHWSKEVRYPYLDESFISWVLKLPVWEKCGFQESKAIYPLKDSIEDESDGQSAAEASQSASELEPGKKLLRVLAWRLGLKSAASEKKRAIQFGARTAKMETGKVLGTQLIN